MSQQHTPEPWEVDETVFDNDGMPETVITGLDGRAAIAVTLDFGKNNPGMREANARRIVACADACVGISTENLEQNEPLIEGLFGLNERIRNTEQQRDELQRINTLLFQDAYSVYTDACESTGHDPELMEVWQQKYLRVIDRQAKAKEGAL